MDCMDDNDSTFENEESKDKFPNPLHSESPPGSGDSSPTAGARLGRFASKQGHSVGMVKMVRSSYDAHDPDQVDRMQKLFNLFDTDRNGSIDAKELQDGLERQGVRISPVESKSMLSSIDRAGTDGEINFDDFYDVMHRARATTGEIADVIHAFVGVRGTVTGSSKLILECEEDEEHLAGGVQGEGDDLFDILQQGLADKVDPLMRTGDVDEALNVFNMADTDANSLLDPKELREIAVNVMGASVVTDEVFRTLFLQIDVDDSGDITIGEFKDWWHQRMADTSEHAGVDPQAVALHMMEQQSNMISPNSKFRQHWDIVQAIVLAYVAISVPYRICFDDPAALWSFWFTVDVVLDLYFIVDIFLNFRTAIITRDGEVVYEHRAVAIRYARSWLPIDFISSLPFGYLHYVYPDANNRAARLFRLLKLLRLVRMKRILDRWEEDLYSLGIVKLVKLVVMILVSAHWLCCGWFFVGCPLPDEEQQGWVVRAYDNFNDAPKSVLYLDSAFWALMAVVMVGTEDKYGNRHPTLGSEKLMFAASFMVGAVIMSLIIGNISDIIANANPGATAQSEALGQVHTFMYQRKLGGSLTRRVRNHFSTYYSERGTTVDMQSIFDRMPMNLQQDLAAALRFTDDKKTGVVGCFSKVPFLSQLELSDLILIGCRMQHQHAHPPIMSTDGNVVAGHIMKEGDRGTEMWIIVDGSVRVESVARKGDTGKPLVLGKLRVNECFGELAVLVQESPGRPFARMRSAYALSTCVLLSLNWNDMQELRRSSVSIDLAVIAAIQICQKIRPSMFDGKTQSGSDQTENQLEAIDAKLAILTKQMSQMASSITELKAARTD